MSNNLEWHNEIRKLGDLIPASYNPRKLTEKQHDDLKKSLEKFNLAELPVVNANNDILAGHMRIRIMTELYGREHEIEVRMPSRLLNEEEAKEYNIRSNKNVGEWDFDILANEFNIEELEEWGFGLNELGQVSDFSTPNDPMAEWEGMPAYDTKSRGVRLIVVHFQTHEDVKLFQQKIGQKINEKTKYIWFPEREKDDLDSLSFENES